MRATNRLQNGWLHAEWVEGAAVSIQEDGTETICTSPIDRPDLLHWIQTNRYPELTMQQFRTGLRRLCIYSGPGYKPSPLRDDVRSILAVRINELGRKLWGCSIKSVPLNGNDAAIDVAIQRVLSRTAMSSGVVPKAVLNHSSANQISTRVATPISRAFSNRPPAPTPPLSSPSPPPPPPPSSFSSSLLQIVESIPGTFADAAPMPPSPFDREENSKDHSYIAGSLWEHCSRVLGDASDGSENRTKMRLMQAPPSPSWSAEIGFPQTMAIYPLTEGEDSNRGHKDDNGEAVLLPQYSSTHTPKEHRVHTSGDGEAELLTQFSSRHAHNEDQVTSWNDEAGLFTQYSSIHTPTDNGSYMGGNSDATRNTQNGNEGRLEAKQLPQSRYAHTENGVHKNRDGEPELLTQHSTGDTPNVKDVYFVGDEIIQSSAGQVQNTEGAHIDKRDKVGHITQDSMVHVTDSDTRNGEVCLANPDSTRRQAPNESEAEVAVLAKQFENVGLMPAHNFTAWEHHITSCFDLPDCLGFVVGHPDRIIGKRMLLYQNTATTFILNIDMTLVYHAALDLDALTKIRQAMQAATNVKHGELVSVPLVYADGFTENGKPCRVLVDMWMPTVRFNDGVTSFVFALHGFVKLLRHPGSMKME